MSITCWEPKNINCKSSINTKCEDMLCSMIKTIEVIGVAGINYIKNTPNITFNLQQLKNDTKNSINKISESCPNCIIKDCTSVLCCIEQSIGVIGSSGLNNIPANNSVKFQNIKTYTQFLIDTMYSKVNCLTKNVNCTSVLCCISQAIGVIGASGLNNIKVNTYENIKTYTNLLIDAMYSKVNCLNRNVNCTDIQCCISQAIGVIGSSGLTAISRQPDEGEKSKTYTNLLIDAMYSNVNCLNKNVNCKDIQCCIEQSIGVIDFSLSISLDPDDHDFIEYADDLKGQITINCK